MEICKHLRWVDIFNGTYVCKYWGAELPFDYQEIYCKKMRELGECPTKGG